MKTKPTMENLRNVLNNALDKNGGEVTEEIIKVSQQLDNVIVEKIKESLPPENNK